MVSEDTSLIRSEGIVSLGRQGQARQPARILYLQHVPTEAFHLIICDADNLSGGSEAFHEASALLRVPHRLLHNHGEGGSDSLDNIGVINRQPASVHAVISYQFIVKLLCPFSGQCFIGPVRQRHIRHPPNTVNHQRPCALQIPGHPRLLLPSEVFRHGVSILCDDEVHDVLPPLQLPVGNLHRVECEVSPLLRVVGGEPVIGEACIRGAMRVIMGHQIDLKPCLIHQHLVQAHVLLKHLPTQRALRGDHLPLAPCSICHEVVVFSCLKVGLESRGSNHKHLIGGLSEDACRQGFCSGLRLQQSGGRVGKQRA
mmetsp:Transcript_23003/g.31959  ORF Transcript_23003/g.31959 Transcript_23003/m.31959 type:complete len:313 (-) Transcript_23003:497-1435(-)